MEPSKVVWYLENFSMMKVLKPSELDLLEKAAKMTSHKNEVLDFPEKHVDTIFLLKKGEVKISRFSDSGQEIILALLGAGEVFGGIGFGRKAGGRTSGACSGDRRGGIMQSGDIQIFGNDACYSRAEFCSHQIDWSLYN